MAARREPRAILALALLAGLRVLALAAGFPFFHQVDEHQHVDTIHRWSRGELPAAPPVLLEEPVVGWALRFGSLEYLEPDPPPPYLARPGAPDAPWVAPVREAHAAVVNQEAASPPVYYAIAGLWYRLGEIWLADLDLLFWLRAFNALLLGVLVYASHRWLRRQAPDDPLLHWGVPALLAFLPQDAFYGVSPDGFCALTGGLAFAAAVEAARPGERSSWRDARAGGLLAVAFLSKYTNVVYAGVLGLALLVRAREGEPAKRVLLRAGWAALAGVAVAAPWLARNRAVLGDPLGTAAKVAHLEWTPLPWSAFLAQPIASLHGLAAWAPETLALFWRGEFRWGGEAMTLGGLDAALATVSLGLLAAGSVSAWRALGRGAWLEPLAFAATLAGFATLAVLSGRFEFADWGNPTRVHPYFTEGRLVLGVLVPFAIVFVRGLALLCARLPAATPWWILGAWLVFVTATDLALASQAFGSPWSWLRAG